jgi:hypothetical protein
MENTVEKSYNIGGRTYLQRELVYGQIKQVKAFLSNLNLDFDNPEQLINSVIEQGLIPQACAIVLTQKDAEIKSKNLSDEAEFFEYNLPLSTGVAALQDFFEVTPVVSLYNMVSQILLGVSSTISTMTGVTGLTNSSPSYVAETLPNETQSSGDTPPESPSPSSV